MKQVLKAESYQAIEPQRDKRLSDEQRCLISLYVLVKCGSGSVVGTAIGYGLDGLGIESRQGRDFPHLSRPTLGPTAPPVQWVLVLSRGKERPGRDADRSLPSSAVVNKEQSYTSTPSMGRTACKKPQCLYKGALQLFYLCLLKYTSLYEATTAFVSALSSRIPKAPYIFSNKGRDDYRRNSGTRCCTISNSFLAFAFVFTDETKNRMGCSLFWDFTQLSFVVCCQRFETAHRFHLQGSISRRRNGLLNF